MRSGYFESELTGYDENGLPIFDRAENDEFFTRVWRYLLKNGVMSEPADNFMVSADTGMNIKVNKGFGIIQGKFAYEDIIETLTVDEASEVYARIDAVVLRLDLEERKIEVAVKAGIPSASPKVPDLDRTDEGLYELCLAYVRVEAGATEIKSSNITDKRNDAEVCGLIQAIGNVNDKNIRIGVPSQKGSLIYTGETISPVWTGYDPEVMDISGDEEGLEPNTYTAIFRPHEGYAWSDGSTLQKEVEWTIQKIPVQSPTFAASNFPYDGETHTITINNYDATLMTKTGTETGSDAGSYSVVFNLNDGAHYRWSTTGNSAPLTLKWTIGIVVENPAMQTPSIVYTGSPVQPTVDYDQENVNVTIEPATVVGSYSVTCSLKNASIMVWEDGTTANKTLSWSITKKALPIPTLKTNPEFSGAAVSPTLNNYDSNWMNITNNSKTNVGEYTATVSLSDPVNTKWADESVTDKSIAWEVLVKVFTIPTAAGNSWSGASQTANLNNFNGSWMTKSGTAYDEVGSGYVCTVALNNKVSTRWADGTTTDKDITWGISKRSLAVPTFHIAKIDTTGSSSWSSRMIDYTGYVPNNVYFNNETAEVMVSPNNRAYISGYDSGTMTATGDTTGKDPGNYVVTFALKDTTHYQWSDGTIGNKEVSWIIVQGAGNFEIYYNGSPYNSSLTPLIAGQSYQFTIVGNPGDTITVDEAKLVQNFKYYFDCSVNGATYTLTPKTLSGTSSKSGYEYVYSNPTEKYKDQNVKMSFYIRNS